MTTDRTSRCEGLGGAGGAGPTPGQPDGPAAAEVPPPEAATRLPFGCGRCENRWGGLKTCHCPTCHENFSTVAGFDAHRSGGVCTHPSLLMHEWGEARFKLSDHRLGRIWVRDEDPSDRIGGI
jgi:hypothetical protein